MKSKLWLSVALTALVVANCSKKPKPQPEPPPPPPAQEVETAPPPAAQPPRVDEAALRRQRIQSRINEVVKPIYFAYDQSTLSNEAKATLQAIGSLMKEFNEVTVRAEGHADDRGTNEYNLALGERRARAAQEYLANLGVAAGRLSTISYGEEKPASEGGDESAWSNNRRAEFTASF